MEKVRLPGLLASIAISVILLILTLCLSPNFVPAGDMGLSLPSPNEWHLTRFIGWLLGAVVLFLCVTVISQANQEYHFVPTADYVLPALLLIFLATNALTTFRISTSTLLLATNIVTLYLLFGTYEAYNATRKFFIIGSFIAFGTMIQYAFLMMIPVYLIGGIVMKSMRFRELIAFIFGLAAPYWIFIGFGITPLENFKMPEGLQILNTSHTDHFIALISGGIMAVLGIIFSLNNSVRLLTRNARLRAMHITINAMGLIAVLGLVFNFNNFVAYLGTISLWFAIETSLMFVLYNLRNQTFWASILSLIFLVCYFCYL